MPRRATRYCTLAGCGAAATLQGRCTEHLLPKPRPRTQAPKRPSRQALGYDQQWLNLSARIRKQRPVCQHCGQRPSQHIDHIDGDRTNHAASNLQALCRSCHSTKTCRQDGGYGNRRRSSNRERLGDR